MKNIFLLLSIFSLNIVQASIDTLKPESRITDVTVFFNGAQITRVSSLSLDKGMYLIVIDKLPLEINPQSIQLAEVQSAKILSVKSETSIFHKKTDPKLLDGLNAEIEEQRYLLTGLSDQVAVFELEEKLLLDNSRLGGGPNGRGIAEIREAADYYRQRLGEIREKKLAISRQIRNKEEDIKDLFKKVAEGSILISEVYTKVLIAIESEGSMKRDLSLSYFIGNAGWEPVYDFRVEDISMPLQIVYNANVFQSTGEDWKNVNLKLSTNKPSLSGVTPSLSPWHLGRAVAATPVFRNYSATIKGIVRDAESGEPVSFANLILEQNGQQIAGATSDFDGNYTIKPVPTGSYNLRVSVVGYQTLRLEGLNVRQGKITFFDLDVRPTSYALEAIEVVDYKVPLISADRTSVGGTVTSEEIARMPNRSAHSVSTTVGGVFSADGERAYVRGSRTDETRMYVDGIRVRGSSSLPQAAIEDVSVFSGGLPASYGNASNGVAQINAFADSRATAGMSSSYKSVNYNSGTRTISVANIEYEIRIPYTIISDGEDHSIKIKEVSADVEYIYRSVPKLDEDVFLNAQLTHWTDLDLLSGNSSIFYQGTFVGNAYLDVSSLSDTLSVSLGRDNAIQVQRKGNKELRSKSIVSNNVKETIAWDIIVKNSKFSEIRIIIEDQLPLSQWKWVDVDLIEKSGGRLDEKSGAVVWDLSLLSGEKKELRFIYAVKYPEAMGLYVE